jgi:hypothetical protein
MDPNTDISATADCTTYTFTEDFSNYWTAVLYFKARNGAFKRVPQKGNVGFTTANGRGQTVYVSFLEAQPFTVPGFSGCTLLEEYVGPC